MENYIDKNSIVNVEYSKEVLVNTIYKNYKKPCKLFWLIPLGEGREVYQTVNEYDSWEHSYKTLEQCFYYEFNQNKYTLRGNKVYYKPFVKVSLSNNKEILKYFDNNIEAEKYINSLGLDKLNNFIKL